MKKSFKTRKPVNHPYYTEEQIAKMIPAIMADFRQREANLRRGKPTGGKGDD